MVWVQRAELLDAAGALTMIGVGALPLQPRVGQKLTETETAVKKHSNKKFHTNTRTEINARFLQKKTCFVEPDTAY